MTKTIHLLCILPVILQVTKSQNTGNSFNSCPFMSNLANRSIGAKIINGQNLLSGQIGPNIQNAGFNMLNAGPNIGRSIRPDLGNPCLVGAGLANPSLPTGPLKRSFSITSSSSKPPSGISILAENLAIEGPVNVGGQLPFLGTVNIEGTLANIGSGVVSYGCGSSNIGINNEASLANGFGPYMAGQGFIAGQEIMAGPNRQFGSNLPAQGLNGLSNAFGTNSLNGLPSNFVR